MEREGIRAPAVTYLPYKLPHKTKEQTPAPAIADGKNH